MSLGPVRANKNFDLKFYSIDLSWNRCLASASSSFAGLFSDFFVENGRKQRFPALPALEAASVGASRGTVRGAPTSRSTPVWSRVGGTQLPTCAGRRNFASLGRAPSHWLPMVCAVNRLMQISSWAMRGLLWWWCGISWCISSALCIRTFCLLTDIGNVCRTEFWSIGSLVIALVSDYIIASETFLVWPQMCDVSQVGERRKCFLFTRNIRLPMVGLVAQSFWGIWQILRSVILSSSSKSSVKRGAIKGKG